MDNNRLSRLQYFIYVLFITGCMTAGADEVRLNQIQIIGTHNSYHRAPPELVMKAGSLVHRDFFSLNYSHAPLDRQLDRGVRSFELDMNYSAEGFRVFHHPLVDTGSTCPDFTDCLNTVRLWSESHPDHVPLSFLLEIKDESVRLDKRLQPVDAVALDRLDRDIRAVFPPEKLLTPDELRGDSATLPEAIEKHGWPELEKVRGKVFFILHERGLLRDIYTEGRPALEGRAMFVESTEGEAHAAFFIRNNPFDRHIPDLVKAGYMVRTRADSGLRQGRENETRRRDAALASGAHVVTTDFPPGEAHPETGYVVCLPGGLTARCNPVSAASGCAETGLEKIPVKDAGISASDNTE